MTLQAGVDEVGRGPWAGAVVTAAVILRAPIPGVTDSKRLTPGARLRCAEAIYEQAVAWSVGRAEVEEIDRLNIRHATLLAMRRALEGLGEAPSEVLIDGCDVPPNLAIPARAVVGGDASIAAIAAASILAKTVRDAEMVALDARYPGYGFAAHKGYGTAAHRAALERLGPCPIHRRSFAPVRRMLRNG